MSQPWSVIQQMERIVGFERIQNRYLIVPLPPRPVCNISILFMKYIVKCGFTVHGGLTLGHSGHYCDTTGL